MARRIVTAQLHEKIYAVDREEDNRKYGVLKIDLAVELDLIWVGDERKYIVLRTGFVQGHSDNVIGSIPSTEDTEWLRNANITLHTATVRIHQLGLSDVETNQKLMKLEVLTGQDHRVLCIDQKQHEWIEFAKLHWWKFILAILAVYWLLL